MYRNKTSYACDSATEGILHPSGTVSVTGAVRGNRTEIH